MGSRTVSVLAYDGMSAFETGIVTEVFGLTWPDLDVDWYQLKICTERPEPVRVIGGAQLSTPHGLDVLADAETVIVPSISHIDDQVSPELIAALQRAHRNGARLVSICSGAFALAAAGLLDGRRATTHWKYVAQLSSRFPRIDVDPKPLYVDDGDVLTSAGCAAGLDLSMHIVRSDYGPTVANQIARRLVIPPQREGGQAQYIEAPVSGDPTDNRIARSMDWARERLSEPLTVAAMAREALMSTRTYLRQFRRCTGTTPIRWLITQRVHASLPLLETGTMPVERVGEAVGFESPVTFRHHFQAIMRTSPSAYRRTFTAQPGKASA